MDRLVVPALYCFMRKLLSSSCCTSVAKCMLDTTTVYWCHLPFHRDRLPPVLSPHVASSLITMGIHQLQYQMPQQVPKMSNRLEICD